MVRLSSLSRFHVSGKDIFDVGNREKEKRGGGGLFKNSMALFLKVFPNRFRRYLMRLGCSLGSDHSDQTWDL